MNWVERQPVLVTGAHRTGTTWVGRVLAAAPGLCYVSEPLNVLHRPGVFGGQVKHWYTYVCKDNEDEFLGAFRDVLQLRYHLLAEMAALRSPRDVGRMARDAATFLSGRLRGAAALLKDPFAVFSLDWFASALQCRIVVTVRHPAAFASGLKRLNWSFDFNDLLSQPLLMRDLLEAHRGAMQSEDAQDVVGQAGVLWRIIYGTLQRLRDRLPQVHVVRHEDLALNPVGGFRELLGGLGLDFTPPVERLILESSSSRNPAELSHNRTHTVKMDSRASLQNWKRRLSPEEVARVRRLTEGVSEAFYGAESWT